MVHKQRKQVCPARRAGCADNQYLEKEAGLGQREKRKEKKSLKKQSVSANECVRIRNGNQRRRENQLFGCFSETCDSFGYSPS